MRYERIEAGYPGGRGNGWIDNVQENGPPGSVQRLRLCARTPSSATTMAFALSEIIVIGEKQPLTHRGQDGFLRYLR